MFRKRRVPLRDRERERERERERGRPVHAVIRLAPSIKRAEKSHKTIRSDCCTDIAFLFIEIKPDHKGEPAGYCDFNSR
jgi:hypothetical protein